MLLIVVVIATMLMDAVSGAIRRRIMRCPRVKAIVEPKKERADVAGTR
jgi:phosphonate transport system permease protein